MNYDFVKQKAIGKYIVDFYCKDLKLAIEVDGETHLEEGAKERDRLRQNELQSLGVHFLRFDALYVLKDIEFVIKEIGNWIQEYEMKFGISGKIANRRSAESRPPEASGGKFTFALHQPIIR